MTKPQHSIIIDTDPGQDDALAILLALGSPELEVIAIIAVAGNVGIPLTEKNARQICELSGRPDLKVYAGSVRPMVRPLVTAEHVHGKTGLDGPDLPEPTMHAATRMASTSSSRRYAAAAGAVTLCSLGPLTNFAMALVREPKSRRA